MSDGENIRVVCRFRPINSKEQHEEKRNNLDPLPIKVTDTTVTIPRLNKPKLEFTLDDVIWSDSTQEQAFDRLAKPIVEQVITGYNATIFAFGQTGSGKTYTMFGPFENKAQLYARFKEIGIIPRSVNYLFQLLNTNKDILKYSVFISVVEVYKEILRDLLSEDTIKKNSSKQPKQRLQIYMSGKEVEVKGLNEIQCYKFDDVLKYMLKAQDNRKVEKTEFIGHHSSRSHCVVTIKIHQLGLDDTIKVSKLNFGDLAGSELAAKTQAKGNTLKEAGKIHQGLLALENVINSLSSNKTKHVPYKDSNLTRILRDSLGGNAKTTLLVNASPHVWSRQETVSTLRFAKRAKNIKNIATINKQRTPDQLRKRIIELEKINKELNDKIKNGYKKSDDNDNDDDNKVDSELLEQSKLELEKTKEEIERMESLLTKKNEAISNLESEISNKEDTIEEYGKKVKENDITINDLKNQLNKKNEEISKQKIEIEKLNNEKKTDALMAKSFENMIDSQFNDQTKQNDILNNTLSEILKQQQQFYNLMKTMNKKIDDNDIKNNNKFDELNESINNIKINVKNVNYNYKKLKKNNYHSNGIGNDSTELSLSPNYLDVKNAIDSGRLSTVALPSLNQLQSETIDEEDEVYELDNENDDDDDDSDKKNDDDQFLESIENYLHESMTKSKFETEKNNKNKDKSLTISINKDNTNNDIIEQKKQESLTIDNNNNDNKNDIKNIKKRKETVNYSIGKKVDCCDISYYWYSGTIIDIDPFQRKSIKIKYDGFDDKWNEWISFRKSWRLAEHKTKAGNMGNKDKGGVHVFAATKYGQSTYGETIRQAYLSGNAFDISLQINKVKILMQGHMFKRGKFNKEWKRRWFVLRNNNCLFYYKSKNMKETQYKGVISLLSVINIEYDSSQLYVFKLKVTTGRTYIFKCQNENIWRDWISAIECIKKNPFDFKKLQTNENDNNNNNEYQKNGTNLKKPPTPLQSRNHINDSAIITLDVNDTDNHSNGSGGDFFKNMGRRVSGLMNGKKK